MPTFAQTRSIPSTTPREGSSGVDRTLPSVSSPLPSSKTSTSVNVPPTSTATLYANSLSSPDAANRELHAGVSCYDLSSAVASVPDIGNEELHARSEDG